MPTVALATEFFDAFAALPRRPPSCAGQSDAGRCYRILSKTGLSQHSLVELGHSLRISTHFENQCVEEISLEFPVGLVLLTLFKSLGPLMRYESECYLAPGAGTF
jgi:hypothetical protein